MWQCGMSYVLTPLKSDSGSLQKLQVKSPGTPGHKFNSFPNTTLKNLEAGLDIAVYSEEKFAKCKTESTAKKFAQVRIVIVFTVGNNQIGIIECFDHFGNSLGRILQIGITHDKCVTTALRKTFIERECFAFSTDFSEKLQWV